MYTIDNPKEVTYFANPEEDNFMGVVKDEDGDIAYYLNGKIHREYGPARIYVGGERQYYLNGKLHREDGPARICADCTIEYFLNGKYHREDGPAIIRSDGTKQYWLNDEKLKISTDQELKDYIILRMFE